MSRSEPRTWQRAMEQSQTQLQAFRGRVFAEDVTHSVAAARLLRIPQVTSSSSPPLTRRSSALFSMSHVCFKGSTSHLVDSGGTKKLRKCLSSTHIQALTWRGLLFEGHLSVGLSLDNALPCFSPQVQKVIRSTHSASG
ncbi:hypothetical protein ILYODFUR_033387 [Ilyodon furcidens]|uniref:Uncharacterized protein n=1 Tax=Ilyodon furcidens TaxID=33524 RepID=A0ABV0TRL1_9TELE